jgi:hypothetical protein
MRNVCQSEQKSILLVSRHGAAFTITKTIAKSLLARHGADNPNYAIVSAGWSSCALASTSSATPIKYLRQLSKLDPMKHQPPFERRVPDSENTRGRGSVAFGLTKRVDNHITF